MLALLLAASVSLSTPDQTCRVRNYHGTLVRSITRRRAFMRAIGYPDGNVPKGYAVDHIVPLALGGCDLMSNMQLLPEAEWREKTLWERRPPTAWRDGTNTRLLQHALYGCASGDTPEALCAGRLPDPNH